ncbi:hypothetical protein [Sorangium sp. So ce542]
MFASPSFFDEQGEDLPFALRKNRWPELGTVAAQGSGARIGALAD